MQKQIEGFTQRLEKIVKSKIDEALKEFGAAIGKKNLNHNLNTPAIAVTSSTSIMSKSKGGNRILMHTPHQKNIDSSIHLSNKIPSVNFPKIDDDNLRHWLRKYQKYFSINPTPDYEKIVFASIHMEGLADHWYMNFIEGRENMPWERFAEKLLHGFMNVEGGNLTGY